MKKKPFHPSISVDGRNLRIYTNGTTVQNKSRSEGYFGFGPNGEHSTPLTDEECEEYGLPHMPRYEDFGLTKDEYELADKWYYFADDLTNLVSKGILFLSKRRIYKAYKKYWFYEAIEWPSICHEYVKKVNREISKKWEQEKDDRRERELKRFDSDFEQAILTKIGEAGRITDGDALRIKGDRLLGLIDWRQFEEVLAYILNSQGWKASTTSTGADGGVDVYATKHSRKLYLQAKHYIKSGSSVGRPEVQRLIGVAQSMGATDAIMATSATFSQPALDLIYLGRGTSNLGFKLELWDVKKIRRLLDEMKTKDYLVMIEPMKTKILKELNS